MHKNKVVFWEVDLQEDFMLPGGKLYVPGSEKIIPNIRRLVDEAREGRVAGKRRRSAKFYDAVAWLAPTGVGKQQRGGVARPRLDAKLMPSPGDAEHEHDVRFLRK